MFEKIKEMILNKYLASLTRHGLTALAGVLAYATFPGAKELADLILQNMTSIEKIVVTLASAGVALVWSFAQKKIKK